MLQLPIWAFPVKWENLYAAGLDQARNARLESMAPRPGSPGIEEKLDPPIQSLFVFNSNPAIVAPEQDKIIRGLEREDLFTVVSEQFLTDTARYADIVLPATTQLEQFDIMFSWGHLYLSLNRKRRSSRLGEAVPNTELFRRLARAMGFDDRQWQRSDEDMAMEALDWASPAFASGDHNGSLEGEGMGSVSTSEPQMDYAPHAAGNFLTSVGQVRVQSVDGRWRQLCPALIPPGLKRVSGGRASVDPLPTYIPPRESPATNARLSAKYPQRYLAEEITPSSIPAMAICRFNCITPASSSCLSIQKTQSHATSAREAQCASSTTAAASKPLRR